jgi:monoterpene epsilon-lactone hydrolase
MRLRFCVSTAVFLASQVLLAQQSTPASSDSGVSGRIGEDGTAYITRVVPVPETISPEAQESLLPDDSSTEVKDKSSVSHSRPEAHKQTALEIFRAKYPVDIASSTIAGVPVYIVTPLTIPPGKADRVLINLHGGGFTSDSGSLIESVPIANLTQAKVVSVLYRPRAGTSFPLCSG